ncbi:hypothetical protein D3C73_780090 [compost metagenome]
MNEPTANCTFFKSPLKQIFLTDFDKETASTTSVKGSLGVKKSKVSNNHFGALGIVLYFVQSKVQQNQSYKIERKRVGIGLIVVFATKCQSGNSCNFYK